MVYLVFNEGYAASSGESLTRLELSVEAIRLGRLLVELLPDPETLGLLALMLLHESRRTARATADGDLVLLEEQDRTLWDRASMEEGRALVQRIWSARRFGPYGLQASIAAVHAAAPSADRTDWSHIVALYDLLQRADPSPVVQLNRAAAIAMRDGPEAGLALIEPLLQSDDLQRYAPAHSAHAELCRRLSRHDAARLSYRRALELTQQEAQRRFLERRLRELP